MKENDWRIRDQADYLMGVFLKRAIFKSNAPLVNAGKYNPYGVNDHEHCAFCWITISEYSGDLHEGFCTLDEYKWICPECYNDFKDDFHWKLVEIDEKRGTIGEIKNEKI